VVCAVEKNGRACGRVRLAVIQNATKEKLKAFLDGKLEPETTVHTDGWRGYDGLERSGYAHIRTVSEGTEAHVNLPRVHRVFSLLKRWLLGTHQGAVSRKHLQSYLEEYTFRFNRRTAKNICHYFQRLSEGCVRKQCRPYWQIVGRSAGSTSMRTKLTLADILGQPRKKYTREEILAMYPDA
jgi:transposase-like protein